MMWSDMLLLAVGIMLITGGLITLIKKTSKLHQGLIPRAVNVTGYTKFMGALDIIAGACVIFSVFVLQAYDGLISAIIIITYSFLIIYGEKKYKLSSSEAQVS